MKTIKKLIESAEHGPEKLSIFGVSFFFFSFAKPFVNTTKILLIAIFSFRFVLIDRGPHREL